MTTANETAKVLAVLDARSEEDREARRLKALEQLGQMRHKLRYAKNDPAYVLDELIALLIEERR